MCGLATPEEETLIGGLTGRGLDHLTDRQTLKKEDGKTQANKKASFEAAGPAAVGET